MKHGILTVVATLVTASLCSADTQILVQNASATVQPGMTISGTAGGSSGYTLNADGTRTYVGGHIFSFSRTNTGQKTYTGYSVTTSVSDPAVGQYAWCPDPATVNRASGLGGPGGGGGI